MAILLAWYSCLATLFLVRLVPTKDTNHINLSHILSGKQGYILGNYLALEHVYNETCDTMQW